MKQHGAPVRGERVGRWLTVQRAKKHLFMLWKYLPYAHFSRCILHYARRKVKQWVVQLWVKPIRWRRRQVRGQDDSNLIRGVTKRSAESHEQQLFSAASPEKKKKTLTADYKLKAKHIKSSCGSAEELKTGPVGRKKSLTNYLRRLNQSILFTWIVRWRYVNKSEH